MHVRLVTVRTRREHENCVQLAQLCLFATDGQPVRIRAVTNPGGRNPHGEEPANIADGSATSKWLDFNKQPLVCSLHEPHSIAAYSIVTANDNPNRDPVRWRLEGSFDGTSWRVLDDHTIADEAQVPHERHSQSACFSTRDAATMSARSEPQGADTPVLHVRLVTVRTRREHENCVQLAQLCLFATDGQPVRIRAVTNPGGRNPHGEEPANIADGSATSKWLDFNKQPLVCSLHEPHSIAAYSIVTANDNPNRDPVRWRLEGSFDGTSWRVLDDHTIADEAQVPHERHSQSACFSTRGATLPAQLKGPSVLVQISPSSEYMNEWAMMPSRPEFINARAMICISPDLMARGRLDAKIAGLNAVLARCPLQEAFGTAASQFICRAFGLCSAEEAIHYSGSVAGLGEGHIHHSAMRVHGDLDGWQQRLLHCAMREMLHEDPDGLQIVCGLLLRAADECKARKHHVFTLIIERVASGAVFGDPGSKAATTETTDALGCARHTPLDAAQGVIDELKDKAFASVFTEPTKLYYRIIGDATMEGDVDVHGANTYLALLSAALGVRLARSPLLDDEVKGIAAWIDAHIEGIEQLTTAESVGKAWEAVYRQPPTATRVPRNGFFFRGRTPLAVALDCLEGPAEARRCLAPYLELFARFFSATEDGVVVKWLCNAILADESLAVSANTVFRSIASAVEVDEAAGDIRYWLWDLMSGEFSHDRALKLLRFAGVCQP